MAQMSEGRSKKFIEGWTSHKHESDKVWKKFWIVLRGNVIFLFTSDKPDKKDSMIGTLHLRRDTIVCDATSKKGFKFELTTASENGEMKKHLFKFKKDIDCQLWKAYILAITTGIIPTNIRLLPGQQSDVYEAMIEVQRSLGSNQTGQGTAVADQLNQRRHQSTNASQNVLEPPDTSNDDDVVEVEEDPAVRQLNRRIETLAKNALHETEMTPAGSSWPLMEIPETPVASRPQSHSSSSSSQMRHSASAGVLPSQKSEPLPSKSPNARKSFLCSTHPFYSDAALNNNNSPTWFVNCSREQAEEILTTTNKFGTVLMRANSRFPVTGNYVICFWRELNGKVVVSHYNIVRAEVGFKIDVENQHSAMSCLSDVMDFFVKVAGKTAKPLTSNDLTELLGKYQASAFPSVMEEDLNEVEPGEVTSRSSRQRPSLTSASALPSSNRSSSILSSSGSPGSRTSRVSFDWSNQLPSESIRRGSDDNRSSASPNGGHVPTTARSGVNGSPPSYTGSLYGGGGATTPERSPYSETGSVLRGNLSVPVSLEIYTNEDETLKPSSTRGSVSQTTPESVFVGPPVFATRGALDSTSGPYSAISGSPGSAASSTIYSVSQNRRRASDTHVYRTQESTVYRRADSQSSLSSDTLSLHSQSSHKAKLPPPPTPAKPSGRDIYLLMKPPPDSATDGIYHPTSEVGSLSAEEESSGGAPNVRELARMLQNGLAFGN